jgi:hypothetical protein
MEVMRIIHWIMCWSKPIVLKNPKQLVGYEGVTRTPDAHADTHVPHTSRVRVTLSTLDLGGCKPWILQGAGRVLRVAAAARRGSRGRHRGGPVPHGAARGRPSLERHRLEESPGGLSAVYLSDDATRGVAACPERTPAEATGVRTAAISPRIKPRRVRGFAFSLP